jgi:hypothetical protein
MQDIGNEQLLMLLLVMQADFDNFEYPRCIRRRNLPDQPLDRRIDMGAIGRDVLTIGTRDQTALRPRMPWTGGHII